MKSKHIFWIFFLVHGMIAGQMPVENIAPPAVSPNEAWSKWLDHLYEIGVEVIHDTIHISKEAEHLATHEQLRAAVYPANYTWENAQALLSNMHIKYGIWYLINLYTQSEESKQTVIKSVLALDKVIDMERVLVSSFYTCIFFDPQAGTIENGKPKIARPDILEKKLAIVDEISSFVLTQRQQLALAGSASAGQN